MRDRLIELRRQAMKHAKNASSDIERDMIFADFLLANGVIVPPCKVGDTVYRLDDVIWHDECGHCEHYLIGGFGDPSECARTKQPRKHPDCVEIVERQIDYRGLLSCLTYGDFGKTVFLTREEAEAALRKEDEGK